MGAFIVAYLVLWVGVVWYVLRLGAAQRRLQRALEALRDQPVPSEPSEQPASRAA